MEGLPIFLKLQYTRNIRFGNPKYRTADRSLSRIRESEEQLGFRWEAEGQRRLCRPGYVVFLYVARKTDGQRGTQTCGHS